VLENDPKIIILTTPKTADRPKVNRSDAILAILASANGQSLTPVQLQKAAFLLERNGVIDEAPGFRFVPYDYGPFDKAVYDEASALSMQGRACVSPSPWGRWKVYSATDVGIAAGREILERLPAHLSAYVVEVSDWVRKQTFSSLVKSIYEQYPEMRTNSIFQG
jgi:hypothetical protein